jgi:hypothetical protein
MTHNRGRMSRLLSGHCARFLWTPGREVLATNENKVPDPLQLGQRVVSILNTGRRETTYKLATLWALLDHCVQNLPTEHEAALDITIDDLAKGVIRIYWRQLLSFVVSANSDSPKQDFELRQSNNPTALILEAIKRLRHGAGTETAEIPPATAERRLGKTRYEEGVEEVGRLMCREPLRRLQEIPDINEEGTQDYFLFDASWMDKSIGRKRIDEHGNKIRLHEGVAFALASLDGLLKPVLETLWVEDVLRRNPSAEYLQLKNHLFGQDPRIPLGKVSVELKRRSELCFYCNKRQATVVDHVLPRWRVGIDGLANLVQACELCNSNKSGLLPDPRYVEEALTRKSEYLKQIEDKLDWPLEWNLVRMTARGLYLSEPKSPAWLQYKKTKPVEDLVIPELILHAIDD